MWGIRDRNKEWLPGFWTEQLIEYRRHLLRWEGQWEKQVWGRAEEFSGDNQVGMSTNQVEIGVWTSSKEVLAGGWHVTTEFRLPQGPMGFWELCRCLHSISETAAGKGSQLELQMWIIRPSPRVCTWMEERKKAGIPPPERRGELPPPPLIRK